MRSLTELRKSLWFWECDCSTLAGEDPLLEAADPDLVRRVWSAGVLIRVSRLRLVGGVTLLLVVVVVGRRSRLVGLGGLGVGGAVVGVSHTQIE